jgi:hypothetical protein
MEKFLVGTGIVIFPVWADDPRQAIEKLKAEIRYRESLSPFRSGFTPLALAALDESEPERSQLNRLDIGMSLVTALNEGRLNFIVFNGDHTDILAGELQGQYQEPASMELARVLPHHVSQNLAHRLSLKHERNQP